MATGKSNRQSFLDKYSTEWPCLSRSRISKHHAFCSVCDSNFSVAHSGRYDCKIHIESAKHKTAAQSTSHTDTPKLSFFSSFSSDTSVIKAEVMFTDFLIEHNIPLAVADHAGPLFRKMFGDSKIAAQYSCAQTKTRSIPKQGRYISVS